jgi:hypothetical protein
MSSDHTTDSTPEAIRALKLHGAGGDRLVTPPEMYRIDAALESYARLREQGDGKSAAWDRLTKWLCESTDMYASTVLMKMAECYQLTPPAPSSVAAREDLSRFADGNPHNEDRGLVGFNAPPEEPAPDAPVTQTLCWLLESNDPRINGGPLYFRFGDDGYTRDPHQAHRFKSHDHAAHMLTVICERDPEHSVWGFAPVEHVFIR